MPAYVDDLTIAVEILDPEDEPQNLSSYPFTDLRLSRFFAIVELSRQRLENHPGHADQSSHGRKRGAGREAGASGSVGPKMAKLPKVDNPDDVRAQAAATNPKGAGGAYEGPVTDEVMAQGGASYSQNCTRVALAYEMRRRGLDVTATAGTQRGDVPSAYLRSFREDGKYALRVDQDLSRDMSAKDVAAEVEGWPLGGRGIVTMDGHTLNVERDVKTGKAVFVDAQAASSRQPVMSTSQFVRRATSRGADTAGGMAVARVDDLAMSDYSLRYVESSGLSVAHTQVVKTQYPSPPGSDTFPTDAEIAAMVPDDSYP